MEFVRAPGGQGTVRHGLWWQELDGRTCHGSLEAAPGASGASTPAADVGVLRAMARGELSPGERERFAAERREQLERWQAELTEKVTTLVDGEQWQRWLRVAAKFHRYSFRNTMMILMQRPDATAVAGYQAWKSSFGRQVNKGETGIRIFAPVTRRVDQVRPDGSPVVDAAGKPVGEVAVVGFRLASVFDVSQTSGPEVPQPRPQLLTGQAPEGLWDRLQGLLADRGFRVERGDCGGANGMTRFDENLVEVHPDLDDAQAVKTLAHEAAHVLLHPPPVEGDDPRCRGRIEVEAESVAFLVTAAHGLDSSQYTFTYVAGWAESAQASAPAGTSLAEVISSTGSRVIDAADTILTATQPPQAFDEANHGAPVQVERRVQPEQSRAIGHDTSRTRVGRGREQPRSRTPARPTRAPAR